MIAALPMYDWPETHELNDAVWARFVAGLRKHNIDAPSKLSRPSNLEQLWLLPDLLLAQTCSYPLETVLKNKVQYVATPSYAVEGCQTPGHYRSVIVKRGASKNLGVPDQNKASLPQWQLDTCFAFNGLNSMSGYHALKRDCEAQGGRLPKVQVETGGHRASIIAVATGKADVCAIDCVSWAMALKYEPAASDLHVAGWTHLRPGLPLITSLKTKPEVLNSMIALSQSIMGAVVFKA